MSTLYQYQVVCIVMSTQAFSQSMSVRTHCTFDTNAIVRQLPECTWYRISPICTGVYIFIAPGTSTSRTAIWYRRWNSFIGRNEILSSSDSFDFSTYMLDCLLFALRRASTLHTHRRKSTGRLIFYTSIFVAAASLLACRFSTFRSWTGCTILVISFILNFKHPFNTITMNPE